MLMDQMCVRVLLDTGDFQKPVMHLVVSDSPECISGTRDNKFSIVLYNRYNYLVNSIVILILLNAFHTKSPLPIRYNYLIVVGSAITHLFYSIIHSTHLATVYK